MKKRTQFMKSESEVCVFAVFFRDKWVVRELVVVAGQCEKPHESHVKSSCIYNKHWSTQKLPYFAVALCFWINNFCLNLILLNLVLERIFFLLGRMVWWLCVRDRFCCFHLMLVLVLFYWLTRLHFFFAIALIRFLVSFI